MAPTAELERLIALVGEERFDEVERALEAPAAEDDASRRLELARLRGELARRGRGPVVDLVLAARALAEAGHAAAPATAADAARLLHQAGARDLARTTLADAARRWPADEAVRLAKEQLGAGAPGVGSTRAEWELEAHLAAGRVDEALARADALAGDEAQGGARAGALKRLCDLHLAAGRFAEAARARERLAELLPRADGVAGRRLLVALSRWAAGEPDAVASLKALRETTEREVERTSESGERGESSWMAHAVHRVCAHVLRRLDADPARRDAGPAWVLAAPGAPPSRPAPDEEPGVALVRHLLRQAGVALERPLEPAPSMAHVRHALRARGFVTRRIVATEAAFVAALEEGATLVLEEELSSATGFVVVAGFEPVAGLLLLVDPGRAGALLVDLDTQWARSGLSGRSALVVAGLGDDGEARAAALERRGVRHARKLDALDRCQLDEEGQVPPRARIEELAYAALRVAEDVPLAWQLLGDALLARMEAGDLDPIDQADGLTRWFADVRGRFPDAEWPHQTLARLLELQGRGVEAGIAWSDAAAHDPDDHRNHLGMARAAADLVDLEAATRHARRAASAEPGSVDALALLARLALAGEGEAAVERGALLAEIASDIAPASVEALSTRASVEERRDRFDVAAKLLEQAAEHAPRDASLRLRLLRRALHGGAWETAAEAGAALCELAPERAEAWSEASAASWAMGDAQRALDAALHGLERCGPRAELIHAAVTAAATLLPQEQLPELSAAIVQRVASAPRAVADVASSFAALGLDDEALEVARQGLELTQAPDAAYVLARHLLRRPELRAAHRAEATLLLDRTIAATSGAPMPRLVRAWFELEVDPARALALVEETEGADQEPALAWSLMARALEATGKVDRARRIQERLPELYPEGVLAPAELLDAWGLSAHALTLLDGAAQAAPGHARCRVTRALVRSRLGRKREALDDLLAARTIEHDEAPRWLLLRVAHAAEAWDVLEEVAREHVEGGLRDSSLVGYDVWPARARLAGAREAQGRSGELAALLEQAGRHPTAWAIAVELERRLGLRGARKHEATLAGFAPGAARVLEGELR